jgi:hypothetical protein
VPISMSNRSKRTKKITVELDGDTFEVWYRPDAISPRYMRELEANKLTSADRALEMARRFVTEWDILDDDGQRIPPHDERAESFGMPVINAVLNAITKDQYPDPTPAVNTGSFS